MRRLSPMRAGLAAALILLAGGAVLLSVKSCTGGPHYTRLWPAFHMTYTLWDFDLVSGKVRSDETDALDVTNELNWRREVTQDALDPRRVGDVTTYQSGVFTVYTSRTKTTTRKRSFGPNSVTSITLELNPGLYANIITNHGPHWEQTQPSAAGRVAYTNYDSCSGGVAPGTVATCTVVTVVEFDAASLRGPKAASNTPLGGIAVFGQRTVNGMVVHKFMATSLTLK